MSLRKSQSTWETFGQLDAKWAILTESDKKFNQWDEKDFFETGTKCINQFFDTLKDLDLKLQNATALDFGCGIGRLTQALAQHYDHAVGVDISHQMISTAQKIHSKNLKLDFIVNTKNDLSCFETNHFDLVYSFIVLQHVPNRELIKNYLREFIRILKPAGLLYFQLPAVPDYSPARSALLKFRGKIFSLLTALGLTPEFCFNSLKLAPYMHMTHIPTTEIIELIAPCAKVLKVENPQQTNAAYYIQK